MGFIVSTCVDDVRLLPTNDKMHPPYPMSNYLRRGGAKRWDALIYQGKRDIRESVVKREVTFSMPY